MSSEHYDVVIIGSGPGGATMALRLARTGKRILLLERGTYLPRERENWDSKAVFVDARYQADETWYCSDGRTFRPGLHYFVGGNSKVYGGVLLRLRERDFGEIKHPDGISPAWPVKYDVFEPYYQAAEELFHVHGLRGEDPTEPPSRAPYAYPPLTHEPRIAELFDGLKREGQHPFHLPVGILLDERDGKALPHSPCIRCNAFDGYPCLTNGKADAQVICVDPALAAYPNLTLLTESYVERLTTNPSGRAITGVEVVRSGERIVYSGDIVVARLRRAVVGPVAVAVRQRSAPERPGQRLRHGRAQLHAAQQQRRAGDLAHAQPDQISEDARTERLLLRLRTTGHFRSAISRWWASRMGCKFAAMGCRSRCSGFRKSLSIGSPSIRSTSG